MDDRPRFHRDNVPAARRLRAEMTPSERALWALLRDRRLDGWKFRRQHPVGAFVIDFFCDELKLALEIDGGVTTASTGRNATGFARRSSRSSGFASFASAPKTSNATRRAWWRGCEPSPPDPLSHSVGEGEPVLPFSRRAGEGAGG